MSDVAVRATVTHVLSAGARMAVFRADDEGHIRRRFVARDLARPPATGETWHIRGTAEIHPGYGPQVVVTDMKLARPEGRLLARLLAGQRFPGVGEATANRLWDAFGEQLIDVLEAGDAEALLRALPDDNRSRAQVETILLEWPLVDAEPRILAGFDRVGIPPRIAAQLLAVYDADALDRIHDDPYRLLAFTSWKSADAIARRMGIGESDERRLVAACEAALNVCLGDGDTLMDGAALRKAAAALLGMPVGDDVLDTASRVGAIRRRPTGWQSSGIALMEDAIAQRIADELASSSREPTVLPLPRRSGDGVDLNAGQAAAVAMAITANFSLLVGGAGTGKTTTLKAICSAAAAAGIPVEMMALSGRAALRMREATGEMARTIAGWLNGVATGHVDLSTLPLIIIDEASMVDLGSLYRIMLSAPVGCRFLLVGDDGQLPPVGFGLTFHALLGVDAIPRTMLTEVMRQAAETGIPAVAQDVRDGILPDLPAYDGDAAAGVSIATCDARDVVATAVAIRRALPSAQIVGSIKGAGEPTDGGTAAVNAALHDAWAAARNLDPSTWLRGEPVIWTVNDYDLDLWNGSLGKVVGMTGEGLAVRFDEGDRTIPVELLDHLEPAWAITTHKAQGSQFETVVVPVTASRILDRTLLYTALTRATRRVVLVGDPAVIRDAIRRGSQASRRSTWLRQAIERSIAGSIEVKAA